MSCERLPQELIEGIFHYLRQDKRVLKACSNVCRAWLYPAYRLLFYDTSLNWYGLRRVYDPRSKWNAAPFIRRLRIMYASPHDWNEIFPSLDGFQSITSLSFQRLYWNEILPEIRLTISNRFNTIVRLELERVVTSAFSEFAQIICTFRCLESLILGATDWHLSDKASSLLRLPQRFHSLELNNSDLTDILEWLRSFGQDLTLRNVCFLDPWQHYYHIIDTFLRDLGPSLESFRMRLKGALTTVISLSIFIHGQHHFEQE
jgi:hypothetical protein